MNTLALLLTLMAPPVRPVPDTTFWDGNWRRVQRPNAVYYGWTAPLDSGRCSIHDFYITGERQLEALGWPGPPVVKDGPRRTTSALVPSAPRGGLPTANAKACGSIGMRTAPCAKR